MTGTTAWHAEWTAKYAYTDEVDRPTDFEVLLFNATDDDLDDHHPEVDDIESEPTDGSYTRHTEPFGESLYTNIHDDYTVVRQRQPASFDVTGTTGEVDAYAIIWEAALERTIYEEWLSQQDEEEVDYEEWDDEYVFDAIQHWEDDPDFDPETVDPEPFVMLVGELEDTIDLDEYTGEFTAHWELAIHEFL